MRTLFSFLFLFSSTPLFSQSLQELFAQAKYTEISSQEKKAKKFTGEELYYLGLSFFYLEDDEKAVLYLDKALEKQFVSKELYFFKGMSLRQLLQYDLALKSIDKAIALDPQNQEYMNERGLAFYDQEKLDSALRCFEMAVQMPNTYPEPYFWLGQIYTQKKENDKAIQAFTKATEFLKVGNAYHKLAYMNLSELACYHKRDYKQAMSICDKSLELYPNDYELLSCKVPIYNAQEQYALADTLFAQLQRAFVDKKLPARMIAKGSILVHKSEWKERELLIFKSLKPANELLDVTYTAYLMNKNKDRITRVFQTERIVPIEKGARKHVLAEQGVDELVHYSYFHGWPNDNFSFQEFEQGVRLVLDQKVKVATTANYSGN